LAAVALANKMARIAWKLMVTGQSYPRTPQQPPPQRENRGQPDTGSNPSATVLSRCQNLQDDKQMV
jgi:hypothetical protein